MAKGPLAHSHNLLWHYNFLNDSKLSPQNANVYFLCINQRCERELEKTRLFLSAAKILSSAFKKEPLQTKSNLLVVRFNPTRNRTPDYRFSSRCFIHSTTEQLKVNTK